MSSIPVEIDENREICKEEILSEEEKSSEEEIEVPAELSAHKVTPAQSQVSKLSAIGIAGITSRLCAALSLPSKFYSLRKPEPEAGAHDFGDEIGHREWLELQKVQLTKKQTDSARKKLQTLDWKYDGIF